MDDGGEQPTSIERQRLDKWLFFARIAKSRAIAQKWISDDLVRVNGTGHLQSSHVIRSGDRIEILSWRGIVFHARTYVMIGAGDRRGPYEEARRLYRDLGPTPIDG